MRGSGRVSQQRLQATRVDRFLAPGRLGQEELQPLYRRMLGVGHRFGAGQAGQRLVANAGQEQPGQVLAKPPPLGQRLEEIIEVDGVRFQWTGRGRTRQPLRHLKLPRP
jgi:hypothetical protein